MKYVVVMLCAVIGVLAYKLNRQNQTIVSLQETVDYLVDFTQHPTIDYGTNTKLRNKIVKLTYNGIKERDLNELVDSITQYSKEYKISENLVVSVIAQESNFDRYARSHSGAVGLGQIMPRTAKDIAAELGVKDYDPYSIHDNVRFTAHYLSKMLKLFGSTSLAIKAYNAGPGKVISVLRGQDEYQDETKNYQIRIFEFLSVLKRFS